MAQDTTSNGTSPTDRAKRYEEQFDQILRSSTEVPVPERQGRPVRGLKAHLSMLSDLASPRTPTSSDSSGSKLPLRRKLRKVTARIDGSEMESQAQNPDSVKHQPSLVNREDRRPRLTTTGAADESEDSAPRKRRLSIFSKRRSTIIEGIKDVSNEEPPKSSTDSSSMAGEEAIHDDKEARSRRPRRDSSVCYRNKLRKLPPPDHRPIDEKKDNEALKVGFGRVNSKKSKRSRSAGAPQLLEHCLDGDDQPRTFVHKRKGTVGVLREVVFSEDNIYNISAERDSTARELAQKWLDSRKARSAIEIDRSAEDHQAESNTEGSDTDEMGFASEIAEPRSSLTTVERVQLEDTALRTPEPKAYRKSRFYEHFSDSDGDTDLDIEDLGTLKDPYTSAITEQVSRFLAPTIYRGELAVRNLDSPSEDEEDIGSRQDPDGSSYVERLRNAVRIHQQEETDMQNVPATRAGPSRKAPPLHYLQRLLSPIREVETPISERNTPMSRQVSSILRQESPIHQEELSILERNSPSSIQQSPTPAQASAEPQCTHSASPTSDHSSTSNSDYVSCRSSNSISTTPPSTPAPTEEAEVGIARSQSVTKIVEPHLRSVDIPRPKGKEREMPMMAPNDSGVCVLSGVQRGERAWWEQGPKQVVVVPKFACGPSVVKTMSRREDEKVRPRSATIGLKPRAPTPEASVLLRSVTSPAKSKPKSSGKEKAHSIGRPGIAADLEYRYQHDDEPVPSRKRAKSLSEQAVGVHLPIQEPVDIPREELRRLLTGNDL